MSELKKCEFNCAFIGTGHKSIEIFPRQGYRFKIDRLNFYIRYVRPFWIVIDGYTGFEFCREKMKKNAIYKAEIQHKRARTRYIEAVHRAVVELWLCGYETPVNEV